MTNDSWKNNSLHWIANSQSKWVSHLPTKALLVLPRTRQHHRMMKSLLCLPALHIYSSSTPTFRPTAQRNINLAKIVNNNNSGPELWSGSLCHLLLFNAVRHQPLVHQQLCEMRDARHEKDGRDDLSFHRPALTPIYAGIYNADESIREPV